MQSLLLSDVPRAAQAISYVQGMAVGATMLAIALALTLLLSLKLTVVAILFLAVNITGLTFAGVADWINQLFTGVALIVAIAFSTALHRERRHRTRSSTQDPP